MTGIKSALPRWMFDAGIGDVGSLHRGLFVQEGRSLARLRSDHMRNARHCLDTSDARQREALATVTVALFNAALTPISDGVHNRPAILAIEVKQSNEANLGRSDLGVDATRARFDLPRSSSFARSEAQGGVATYIRHRGLALAMRISSEVEEGGRPRRVSAVAYVRVHGNSMSSGKAPRARYGGVPREVDGTFRRKARCETGSVPLSWIKELF